MKERRTILIIRTYIVLVSFEANIKPLEYEKKKKKIPKRLMKISFLA